MAKKETTKKVAKEEKATVEEPVMDAGIDMADEIVEEPADEIVDEPADEIVNELADEIVDEPADKTVGEAEAEVKEEPKPQPNAGRTRCWSGIYY